LLSQVFLDDIEVLRFCQNWINMVVPAVLSKMRNNWVKNCQFSNDESHQSIWVSFVGFGDQIIFFD
jgi:hypothetical protein